MKKYPRLAEMGVLHPLQIDKFSVNSIAFTDVLKIVYKRPKGSLLPESRTYKFPRVQNAVAIDGGAGKTETVMETNPALLAALEELQDLTEAQAINHDIAGSILDELRLMEEDIALRGGCIKELVGKLKID